VAKNAGARIRQVAGIEYLQALFRLIEQGFTAAGELYALFKCADAIFQ